MVNFVTLGKKLLEHCSLWPLRDPFGVEYLLDKPNFFFVKVWLCDVDHRFYSLSELILNCQPTDAARSSAECIKSDEA